jgi:L-amino acid N-acyltransferase YncA
MIRGVYTEDAKAICGIYNHYVKNTIFTFEENPVSKEEMKDRMAKATVSLPWVAIRQTCCNKANVYQKAIFSNRIPL